MKASEVREILKRSLSVNEAASPAFSREHLKDLADAMNAVGAAVRALIADELSAVVSEYEAAVDSATERLRGCVAALEGPEDALVAASMISVVP